MYDIPETVYENENFQLNEKNSVQVKQMPGIYDFGDYMILISVSAIILKGLYFETILN